jgi:hypothetical protein
MNKKIAIPLIMVLVLTVGVLGAVLIHQFNFTVNVSEAFTSTEIDATVDAVLGTTVIKSVTINNAASVSLQAKVSFTETSNMNGIIYTTNSPVTQTLNPGPNVVDLTFTIDSGSPTGSFSGTISIERI